VLVWSFISFQFNVGLFSIRRHIKVSSYGVSDQVLLISLRWFAYLFVRNFLMRRRVVLQLIVLNSINDGFNLHHYILSPLHALLNLRLSVQFWWKVSSNLLIIIVNETISNSIAFNNIFWFDNLSGSSVNWNLNWIKLRCRLCKWIEWLSLRLLLVFNLFDLSSNSFQRLVLCFRLILQVNYDIWFLR
jgi:hypothetical protein